MGEDFSPRASTGTGLHLGKKRGVARKSIVPTRGSSEEACQGRAKNSSWGGEKENTEGISIEGQLAMKDLDSVTFLDM